MAASVVARTPFRSRAVMQCDFQYCNNDKYYIEHHGAQMAAVSRNDAMMMNVMTLTKTVDGDVVIVLLDASYTSIICAKSVPWQTSGGDVIN